MVMLTEDDPPFRSLRIIIGQAEANAIHAAWHGAVPGRPSTWDLYVSTVALLGGRIDRVVINAVHEERHYFAHLEVEQGGERHVLACRPSDAIAVAVRAYNTSIMAEPSVLEAAGVMPDGSKWVPPPEPDLADREAALAARESELAERERLLAAREQHATAPEGETDASELPDQPVAVAEDAATTVPESDEPPAVAPA